MCSIPLKYKGCWIYIYATESGNYYSSVELPNQAGVIDSSEFSKPLQAQWQGILLAEKGRLNVTKYHLRYLDLRIWDCRTLARFSNCFSLHFLLDLAEVGLSGSYKYKLYSDVLITPTGSSGDNPSAESCFLVFRLGGGSFLPNPQ